MSTYSVTVGSDVVTIELGQPEDPILVDGNEIGVQCADGSCRVEDCIRLALRIVYGAPIYETDEDAEAAGRVDGVDNIIVWDDVSYEIAEEA